MKPAKKRWASLRYGHKIRNVLLTYYLTPILVILLASGAFFYLSAKRGLDEEMGQRLISVSLAASYQIRPYQVAALELRDPANLTYQSLLERFKRILLENQAARIYVFNPKNESLLDTAPNVPLGSTLERNRLNTAEIEQAAAGKPAASVLFQGNDGLFYKSAFVPVMDGDRAVAFVGVDASATFFQNLHRLGRRLAYFGFACIFVIVLVSVIISRKIVVPVQHLVAAAERIGSGDLKESVSIETQNEIGFLGFVMDEMRKNIVSRDRELQMMLRGIAHEVRNPLGGIELFAGMLEEEVKDIESRKAVARIQNEIKVLKNLVEEFLDFARHSTLQVSRVSLEEFFKDLSVAFQKEIEKRSIRFSVTANGVKDAEFDVDQMRRVFLNLIRNSLQAVRDGGKVEIGAAAENGNVELRVSDDGVGVPPEILEKVFDPFFTTKEGGTGLGLSFARKIVNAHGGEVRVESAPGGGTTVFILLPR
ncbi:MAG: HAMP domain-containing sensor histidine kinase [Pseudomonadota bacterium]